MSIDTRSKLISALILLLTCITLGTTWQHSHLIQQRDRATTRLNESLAAADLLAASSDVLTNAVRAYAATGDEHYRQQFHRELETFHSREKAVARLNELGATREEMALITRAKQHSDTLLGTESQAFAAISQGNRQDALRLVYSVDYEQAKATIKTPIDEARQLIATRLQQRIAQLTKEARLADTGAFVLLLANTLLILLTQQLFYRRRLIAPLLSMTAKTRRLLAGDSDVRFDEGAPGSEIADLAHALEDSRQAALATRAQATRLENQTAALSASQARIQEAEAWHRNLIESAPDGILVSDEQGIIRLANPKIESLFGYQAGELNGRKIMSLAPASAQSAYAELHSAVLQQDERLPFKRLPGVRKDGSEFIFEASLARLPGRNGETFSLCLIVRDITERQRTEIALERARALAEEAARAKTDFLANMSHEIRTPMNSIIGMTHLALQTRLDAQQLDYLRHIQTASDQLLTLIDDILDFSQLEAGELILERAPFNLQELLDAISRRFADKARAKGLHLTCTAAADLPPWLVGDAGRLAQILAQYADNAIKFTAAGEVEILVRGQRSADSKLVLNVFVRDTGIGLDEKQQAALFDNFYQADASSTRQYGGTGLGLAIVRRLAELMDGEVGVESQPGVGSTFWLSVPLGIGNYSLQQWLPQLDLKDRRVLLVEDNDVNQRLICKLLEHIGVIVDAVDNGLTAVEQVRRQAYDLILMDVQMPVLDGTEATRQIRALGPHGQLPIIAVSASAMPEDRQRCFAAGMNGFLAKPLKVEELYATLQQWIGTQPRGGGTTPIPADCPAVALPEIEGLDTAEGLQRVAGDHALYLDLLRRLVENERDTSAKLRNALAQGDEAQALRLAHTLKGLAGTLGAGTLMDKANTLEQALREQAAPADVAQALAALESRLQPLLQALQRFFESATQAHTGRLDQERLAESCRMLTGYLEEDDAEAATCFNRHAALLRTAFPDAYPQLESAIRRFEFDKALAVLRQLMPQQQADTP